MSAAVDNVGVAKRAMKQKAVYWPLLELDEFGKPSLGEPEEIECRWEEVGVEFIDPEGDRQVSRARLIVDRELTVKGKIKLGSYNRALQEEPHLNDDVWEIRQVAKTPDFKGRKFLREVYL